MNPIELLLSKINDFPVSLWEENISLKRNEFLCRKGETNRYLYFVVKGSLRIYIETENEDHTIRFGYPNSILGALDSFLNNKPTEYYIQTIKECELKVIHKDSLMQVMNASPENMDLWNTMLEQLIVQQLEREVDILTTSPMERYNRLVERSPQVFQEIPSKYIASYLRMSPETLSRIKKY